MHAIDFDKSVADWAIDYPAAIAVFERHGVDYCCGGKSLAHACRQAGVDLSTIAARLREIVRAAGEQGDG